jgi:hypothetical protein
MTLTFTLNLALTLTLTLTLTQVTGRIELFSDHGIKENRVSGMSELATFQVYTVPPA